MAKALAITEAARLSELEQTIERGLGTFFEVGQALVEIREGKLYRENFSTFEDYCAERWGFTGRRARQLITAAEIGTMVPLSSERQARELAPLKDEPERLRAAWESAVANGEPTARTLRAEVERRPTAQPQQDEPLAEIDRLRAGIAAAKRAVERAQARLERAEQALRDYREREGWVEW